MKSVLYVINNYLQENKYNFSILADINLDDVFNNGQNIIKSKIASGKAILNEIKNSSHQIKSESFWYTYRGLNHFFKKYNPMFFAHQVQCDIDYPLMIGADESLLGIDYINEYLKRFLLKKKLINLFDIDSADKLLTAHYIDYENLPVNLCEPLLVNACAEVILCKDSVELNMSESDVKELLGILTNKTTSKLTDIMISAAKELSEFLHINDSDEVYYISAAMINIVPRLKESLLSQDLSTIFYAL